MRAVLKQVHLSALERKANLTFEVTDDFEEATDISNEYYQQKCMVTVKKQTKAKSRNANAYCWVLCDLLAEKLNVSKEDIYRQTIREVGISRDIELREDAASTMQRAWEGNGVGWFSETVDWSDTEGFLLVRFYYGSSVYNSKQMSRLIDRLVEDCKENQIPTETPEQIALMKEEWGK